MRSVHIYLIKGRKYSSFNAFDISILLSILPSSLPSPNPVSH